MHLVSFQPEVTMIKYALHVETVISKITDISVSPGMYILEITGPETCAVTILAQWSRISELITSYDVHTIL